MTERKRIYMGIVIALLMIIICSGLGTFLIALVASQQEASYGY